MGVLQPGQQLEGTSYQVVYEIGSGGMGVVYEIEHVRLKKRYVAKVIHEAIVNDDDALPRMEREAQVLAELNHPNVVQVHDVGTTTSGVHYFVMEKLEGVDLRRFMNRAPVTVATALRVMADVLSALGYVHERGIVHRDIKPENIFLAEQPHGKLTKVLDFGVAHLFDKDGRRARERITKSGGFAGTLLYASPEQLQGKTPGPPNDVYAAALVLFELLSGKGPFDDDPGVGLSRCFKPAPSLADRMVIDPQISAAVARALEQDPAARPTAATLAAELRRIGQRIPEREVQDDPIGNEVDELLRHMPLDRAAPVRPQDPRRGGPTPAIEVAPTLASGMPAPVPSAAPITHPVVLPHVPSLASAASEANAAAVGFAPPTAAVPQPPTAVQHLGRPTAHGAPAGPMAPHGGSAPLPSTVASGPPPRRGETSPGLYSTVDRGASVVPVPPPPRGRGVAIGAGALGIVAAVGLIAVLALRAQRSSSAEMPAPAASVEGAVADRADAMVPDVGSTAPGPTVPGATAVAGTASGGAEVGGTGSGTTEVGGTGANARETRTAPAAKAARASQVAPLTVAPTPSSAPPVKPKAAPSKDSVKDGYLREL